MYNFLLFCLLFTNWAFATTFITPEETKDLKINGYSSFGDVNGDGYNDIFTSEFYYFNCGSFQCVGQVEIDEPSRIFINDQRGGFEELIQEVGFGETSLTDISLGGLWARGRSFQSVIADVNNDDKNDIIASDGRVFINKGDGQFEEPVRPGIGSSINKISVIDIDNDGVLEIYNSGKLRKRTNLDPLTYSGDNSFTFDTRLSVEFADFNNDGLKDILTYGGPSKVTIYYNQPNGFSHNNKLVFDVSEPEALVVGDIDGNGTSDVILSNNNSLINIGGGQFEMANLSLDFGFYDSVIDDFEQYTPIKLIKYNNDNDPDLLIRKNNGSREFSDYFFVLINDGQGAFSIENAVSSIINTISGVMTSDFNNDSYEDFIVGKYGGLNTYNFNMAIDDEYHNHNIDPAISIEVYVH